MKKEDHTMSQIVTLLAEISPVQSLAIAALTGGATVSAAAAKAGVARETVSRWLHGDPVFIAELQAARSETAAQTRCALEALGKQSVAVLCEALKYPPSRFKAACVVLKLLGADRAEIVPPPTAEEVQYRISERRERSRTRSVGDNGKEPVPGRDQEPSSSS
jgi:hypothetical protein